ncbi:MAG: DUF177 domain-containing protein [Proteobacteria bacterium]|nr:DUF177 domain-containing protein [Pseudomonadota bacterium]
MSKKSGPARGPHPAPAAAGIAEVVPWSVPVTLDQITDSGLHRDIEAPESVRLAIAKLAGLRDVPELTAAFDLAKTASKVHVSGRVHGRIGQTCVVSLEPMETVIDEPIDLTFAPPAAGAAAMTDVHGVEPRRSADDDAPEPLVGNSIDLGAIASEFLVLAIDPYPRKEGAEFAPPEVEKGGNYPFAALAALKKEPGKSKN